MSHRNKINCYCGNYIVRMFVYLCLIQSKIRLFEDIVDYVIYLLYIIILVILVLILIVYRMATF